MPRVQTTMRRMTWVWFAGFAAWLLDALVSLRGQNFQHAELALLLAAMFLIAGLFFRLQQR